MKIGAIVAVNCDKDNIWFCLKGVYDFCDKIIIVYSDTTWLGNKCEDGTLEAIKAFEDSNNKIEIIEGSFDSQPTQREVGLRRLRELNYDFVFVVDSDEIYDPRTIIGARSFIIGKQEYQFAVKWRMFWKTLGYELKLNQQRLITVFYRLTNDFRFKGPARQAGYNKEYPIIEIPNIDCYHLTCVCDDEHMKQKIETRTYRTKVVSDWYTNKWLNWRPEVHNLHPTDPKVYKRAIKFNLNQWPGFMKKHRFYR